MPRHSARKMPVVLQSVPADYSARHPLLGLRRETSAGDLSGLAEPGTDYATVAMRFSMIDVKLDLNWQRHRASQRSLGSN